MSQRKLLTSGNVFRRTDGRWGGTVWYLDERAQRLRKSFSGTTKTEVGKKITEYISEFNKAIISSDESRKTLRDSMTEWLRVFKFPNVERTSYDRLECTARCLVFPHLGDKAVGDVTSADIQKLLNRMAEDGYAYTTAKKVYNLFTDYFRHLAQQEHITKNPMTTTPLAKRANYLASQGVEAKPTCETVTVFSPEELDKFKAEAFRTWGNGKRIYQQAAAYILMLNTGLRTGEALGLLNSDVDIENKVLHVTQSVKEVAKREGPEAKRGREVKVGKPKSATSKRDVPLNASAIDAINDLRAELYFGEGSPLICDETGDYTRPVNFRKRYYRILKAAGIERKGLHSLRHTFATNLVNGIRQPDGSIKSLTPRQVADLLGHSTSEITELYYVKKDTARLAGTTEGFEL